PQLFDLGLDEKIPGYSGKAYIYLTVSTSAQTPIGEHVIPVTVGVQACRGGERLICLRESRINLKPVLKVVPPQTQTRSIHAEKFVELAQAEDKVRISFFGWDRDVTPTLILMVLIAMIGGFLLNLTPCVLPVIPIKIMSLAHSADNRRRCLMLGAATSLGVMGFWLGIGTAIALSVKAVSGGGDGGFGSANQLFQYPLFTVGVGLIIAVLAVGMCGLFAIRLPKWVYKISPRQDTLSGSFGMGVMTAVLSTPCTAPFMGSAAAWAATQHAATTLLVFTAIGAGMALPYFILAAFPNLVQRMPRTGPASDLIKQVMGLLMLAAAFYFLGTGIAGLTADPPDPPTRLYWWAVGLTIAAAGVWLAWRCYKIVASSVRQSHSETEENVTRVVVIDPRFITFAAFGALMVAAGLWLAVSMTDRGPIDWVYYTPERLAEAQQKQKVVVLEFTAEWCINCHALEQAVLNQPKVVEALNRPDVTPIKVDLTGNNILGNQKLIEVGRRTIPLLIIYDRNGREIFRSDAYTAAQILDTIAAATTPDPESRP
ncbi:MAG: cytochrome c biogenesis protein CcdA, partial [Phycisphaeraceae bacterium]|nr:cytochrome c biogenesis protein CcdA [Phycisphaeraceae bacterium]